MRSRAAHEGRHRRTHQGGFGCRHHAYTRELFEASFLEAGITDSRSLPSSREADRHPIPIGIMITNLVAMIFLQRNAEAPQDRLMWAHSPGFNMAHGDGGFAFII